MAKKNVFMKKLGVVDAFGAATVIASDKTGTLTTNDMAVTDAWAGLRYINGNLSIISFLDNAKQNKESKST